jgi:DNA-binding CsgD family transcriptional regulator
MLKSRNLDRERIGALERIPFLGNTTGLPLGFLLPGMLEAFDLVGVGLGIVDSEGRLLHCNEMAEEILARRDGLEITPSRTLRAGSRNGSVSRGLLEQLRDTTACDAEEPEQIAILAVPRPSGKRPLTLLVRFADSMPNRPGSSNPPTLVFIVDPEISLRGMESHVRLVYGLTAAETELATLLMQGNSLTECGQQMGIRRPTVASHLRQLFNKTQARTQSQLVSVLFRRFGLLSSLAVSRKPGVARVSGEARKFPILVSDRSQNLLQTHSFGGRQ